MNHGEAWGGLQSELACLCVHLTLGIGPGGKKLADLEAWSSALA